ncbi:MAG: Uma2 family endonuclease [Chloroflexi bacterium]|nr:Uma2 family endonuclease [Chloroflexota bacterium]
MTVQVLRRRFTVEDYHRMAQAGVLGEDDRVELIEGEIVEMAPIGSRHAACVKRLNRMLSQRVGDRALIGVQDPVQLGERSEPEPDVALLQPRADGYASGHPGPDDVLLLIEVADTTLAYDRGVKIPLYGRAGVPETWLVDLEGHAIEQYTEPSPQGYRLVRRLLAGERISPQAFPDVSLAIDDLLI